MNPEIKITKETLGYCLSVQTKYKLKLWPWAYETAETAEHVKNKIQERWDDCIVQQFEDYTTVFTDDSKVIKTTPIKISEMTESWSNTPYKKIDLRRVSGYNGVSKQS